MTLNTDRNLKKIISYTVFMAALTGCLVAFAQNRKGSTTAARTESRESGKKKDNLNQSDNQGKQGLWFYKYEARMGEPLTFEYGNYTDGKKTGLWTRLDAEQLLLATENYSNGVLNGTAQYYEDGRLICVGTYRGLNQAKMYDSIWVTDPVTYIDTLVAISTEIGYTKHGLWRYYDARTGQLTREEEYQVDNLIHQKEFYHVSKTDSLNIQRRNDNLPHKRKSHDRPPSGKGRSLIN